MSSEAVAPPAVRPGLRVVVSSRGRNAPLGEVAAPRRCAMALVRAWTRETRAPEGAAPPRGFWRPPRAGAAGRGLGLQE
eukprot:13786506-Alexandrium_andersonii.AAC.1